MEQYLQHHGILGQKWGVRRYQNADGSLTSAGKKRYGFKEKIGNAKERYKRGSKINSFEYSTMKGKLEELEKNNVAYSKTKAEREYLERKHSFSRDDEEGTKDTENRQYSREERAGKRRYDDLLDKEINMYSRMEDSAATYAREQVIKKYGDKGVKDLNFYANTNAVIAASAIIAISGAMTLAELKYGR